MATSSNAIAFFNNGLNEWCQSGVPGFGPSIEETALTIKRWADFLGAARQAAEAVRGHWRIENSLHWVLDVVFNDDQSRLRKGHGAKNMAVVRHFAFNLVRAIADRRSLKSRRKIAGWDTAYSRQSSES